MISAKAKAMLDRGMGCYFVAASTNDRYIELQEYVSRNAPDENSPERQAFWEAAKTSPYVWRQDNQSPKEAPWSRVVR